jgi:hypothetical protein
MELLPQGNRIKFDLSMEVFYFHLFLVYTLFVKRIITPDPHLLIR